MQARWSSMTSRTAVQCGGVVQRCTCAIPCRSRSTPAIGCIFGLSNCSRKWVCDPDDLHLTYDRCHRTLLRAHFGQALDLGAKVDTLNQATVAEVCMSSMRLKTGALMGFAALLGGAIAQAPEKLLIVLDDFGRDLGVALQMFDDIGNVIGKCEPSKRFEDLILSRPSWVWATAARVSAPEIYGAIYCGGAPPTRCRRLTVLVGKRKTWLSRRVPARAAISIAALSICSGA